MNKSWPGMHYRGHIPRRSWPRLGKWPHCQGSGRVMARVRVRAWVGVGLGLGLFL